MTDFRLTSLSLARFTLGLAGKRQQVDHVPTNDDRALAFNRAIGNHPPIGNTFAWPYKKAPRVARR